MVTKLIIRSGPDGDRTRSQIAPCQNSTQGGGRHDVKPIPPGFHMIGFVLILGKNSHLPKIGYCHAKSRESDLLGNLRLACRHI